MSGPQLAPQSGFRQAQPLDTMLLKAGGAGWDGLEQLFRPQLGQQPLQPADGVALFLFRMSQEPRGRDVIEWLMDITVRQPLRVTGASLEETALRAAQRQGINGVAEAVLAAIDHGRKLAEKGQS